MQRPISSQYKFAKISKISYQESRQGFLITVDDSHIGPARLTVVTNTHYDDVHRKQAHKILDAEGILLNIICFDPHQTPKSYST